MGPLLRALAWWAAARHAEDGAGTAAPQLGGADRLVASTQRPTRDQRRVPRLLQHAPAGHGGASTAGPWLGRPAAAWRARSARTGTARHGGARQSCWRTLPA